MKKTTIIAGSAFLAVSLFSGFYMGSEKEVAVITRIYSDVKVKTEKGDWQEAKKAAWLANGDNLRTGEKATAVLKFKDGSVLRIRPNSELAVYADRAGTKIDKQVQIDVGAVGFDVRKRKEESFSFSSPTSVASIRGTDGGYSIDDNFDMLFVNTGLASLTNKANNQSVEVGSGQVGALDKKGGVLDKRTMTDADKQKLTGLQSDADGAVKTLKIDVEMPDGSKKSLEIEIEE